MPTRRVRGEGGDRLTPHPRGPMGHARQYRRGGDSLSTELKCIGLPIALPERTPMPPRKRTPALALGGSALWASITKDHTLDAVQEVTLLEACRAKDRLDEMDELLRAGVDRWVSLVHDDRTQDYELKVNVALANANATATLLKQLLAALRLPDKSTGKRPQRRGGARGVYARRGYWNPD
jgi:hypothetical protein